MGLSHYGNGSATGPAPPPLMGSYAYGSGLTGIRWRPGAGHDLAFSSTSPNVPFLDNLLREAKVFMLEVFYYVEVIQLGQKTEVCFNSFSLLQGVIEFKALFSEARGIVLSYNDVVNRRRVVLHHALHVKQRTIPFRTGPVSKRITFPSSSRGDFHNK
ncbi:unnamed protein product [Darwinula stevensoni]|uniref:Uncharacterized protein n=1 Tax=Darwinula stevensoni TaxID=69355 RepID=A0A7R8ZYV0_9CRUS|nr:unnamed protein product [Darwinula stevensoni]CAG0881284.1 unnamed protein product [Darwinula stevensoni]